MNKAYQKLNFVNNQAPDLDAENMNSISTAIDTIDNRVVNQEGRLASAEGTIAHYPEELASKMDKNNPSGTGTLTIGEVRASKVSANEITGTLTKDTEFTFPDGSSYSLGGGLEEIRVMTNNIRQDVFAAKNDIEDLKRDKLDKFNPVVDGVLTVGESAEIGTVKADEVETSSLAVNNINGKNGNDISVGSNMSIVYNNAPYNIGRSISKLEALTTNQVANSSTSPLKNTLYTDIVGIILDGKTTQASGTPTQASPKEFTDASPLVEVLEPNSGDTASKVYGFRSDLLHDNVIGGEIIYNKFYDASGNLQEGSFNECVVYIDLEYNQWEFIAYNVQQMSNRGWVWLDNNYRVISVALNRNNADGTPNMLERPSGVSMLGLSLTIAEIANIRGEYIQEAIGLYHYLPLRNIENLRDEIMVVRQNEGQYFAIFEQNIEETVYRGTEADSYYTFVNGNPCSVTTTMNSFGGGKVVCNAFTEGTGKDHFSVVANKSEITFYINQTSLSDFKAYLRQHPVKVRYKKSQAQSRPLEDWELNNILSLRLDDGETIVRCNADWNISYPIDMKTYSDNEDAKLKENIDDNAKAIEELKARPSGATAYYSKTSASPLAESIQYGILGINARGNSKQSGTPTPSAPIPIVDASSEIKAQTKNLWTHGDITKDSESNIPFVLEKGTYTFSCDKTKPNLTFRMFTTPNMTTADSVMVYIDGNSNVKTFTLANKVYGFNYNNPDKVAIHSIQLEEGTTATEYEPHKSNTIEIPYTLRSVGNVKDEIIVNEDGSGQYIKRVGTVDLSTMTWASTSIGSGVYRYYTDGLPNKATQTVSGGIKNIMAEKYIPTSDVVTQSGYMAYSSGAYSGTGGRLFVQDTTTPSGKFYYPLNTPEIIDLTIDQMNNIKKLMTYKGTTIIASELEIPSVTYAADFMGYIDEADNKIESEIAEIKSRPSFTNESTSPLTASTNNNIVGLYAEGKSEQSPIVTMGSLTWQKSASGDGRFYADIANGVPHCVLTCSKYPYADSHNYVSGKICSGDNGNGLLRVFVVDTAYATADAFKSGNASVTIGYEGTPSPTNPIPIIDASGVVEAHTRNLFNPTFTKGTSYTVVCEKQADNSFTLNGTNSTTAGVFTLGTVHLEKDEPYTLSGCPSGGNSSTYYLQLRTPQNTAYKDDYGNGNSFIATESGDYIVRIYFSTTTFNNVVFKPMLEQGTTASPYVPYQSNAIYLNSRNKFAPYIGELNGLTFSREADGGIRIKGTNTENVFARVKNPIPNGTYQMTYKIVGSRSNTVYIRLRTESTSIVPNCDWGVSTSGQTERSLTVSVANAYYSDINLLAGTYDFVIYLMLNEGTSALPYEPYIENPIILRSIGNIADTLTVNEDGSAEWAQNVGVADMGNYQWGYNNGYFFCTSIPKAYSYNMTCPIYETDYTNISVDTLKDLTITGRNSNANIYLKDSSYGSDASALQRALKGVMLYYELRTPIIHTLTKEQVDAIRQLKTYDGTTLVDAELQNVKVKYQGDIKGYIDSKFDTLYALIRQYHPDVMALADGIAELSEVIENE